jgi:hypothetical protein
LTNIAPQGATAVAAACTNPIWRTIPNSFGLFGGAGMELRSDVKAIIIGRPARAASAKYWSQ